ncbi:MAG: helix-hairpin-helix domain-containing protein, partial [Bacteroidia bacterium]|nr:helix-hairpin-helix domain-containing protein [Bacteroidia bacterium]
IDSFQNVKKQNSNYFKGVLFAFDPNTVSEDELLKLGFKEKTAKTFLKFRKSGFKFKQKEDLRKIYGVTENYYKKLEPYIVIHQSGLNKSASQESKTVKNTEQTILELNAADSLSLISLKGVGPSYAKRIIKYRALLGGFTHIEQLREVYGMQEELFTLIKSQCKINPSLISKLNVNSAEFKVLNKHPYLSYELTKHLVNTRKNTKLNAANIADIIQDETITTKLLPYLEF